MPPPGACAASRARRSRRSPPAGRAGTAAATARRNSPAALAAPLEERGERPQPVTVGRERDVADAGRAEHAHEALALLRRRRREALAEPSARRVDAELPAGLGVDEPQLADVGELLLARVADLDRDRRMAAGDAKQRPVPVVRPPEVGDDDDERALDGEAVHEPQRLGEPA